MLTALLIHASGGTLAISLVVALGTLVVVLVVALRFGTVISSLWPRAATRCCCRSSASRCWWLVRLGALVAAYVLGLAVLGSFAPQLAEPIARRLHHRSLVRAGAPART